MLKATPIYSIAKEHNTDSNRIILACKTLGINAKGAAKKLNPQELERIKNYFETGKNVSHEVIDLEKNKSNTKNKFKKVENEIKRYFPNRLIGKS